MANNLIHRYARLTAGARLHLRVFAAIWRRDSLIRRGAAMDFAFLLAMLEPLIIIGAICLLFYIINRPPIYGTSMVLFVASGVFPVYTFLYTSMEARKPLLSGQFGNYPLEMPLDHVLVSSALHLLSTVTVAILFFVGLYLLGQRQAMPYDLGKAICAMWTLFVLGAGVGIMNSVIGRLLPVWNSIWPAVARASLHFSGIYYLVDYLPPRYRDYVVWNPVVHGVEWFRTALYPFYPAVVMDKSYLIEVGAVVLFAGLALEWIFREKMRRSDEA
jgi:capsular polysaccharide transport system permease protein